MSKQSPLKPLEKSQWEDDKFINTATAYKEGKTEGIAIRTAKKYDKRVQLRKSFWLQKDQKVDEILDWLFGSVKKLFSKFWGKEIITPKEIEASQKLIEDLRNQLKKRESELEELKIKYDLQQKELSLAQELVGKYEDYERTLNQFEEKIKNSVKNNERIEEWIKTEIKNHRWILGLDCEVKAKNKDVDTQTEIDLHIETNYGEERIIEVKSPNLPFFEGNESKRWNLSKDLTTALSEIIEYLQRTQSYSLLRRRGTYAIDKPIGRIIAGYELDGNQKKLLSDWNFHLSPVIKIITFKELIQNARKELELIKIAKKTQVEVH